MSKFYLRIITPERELFSGKVEYLSVNTPSGREGFMRGALNKLAVLSAGRIEITDDGEKKLFECAAGFISVENDGITVITAACRDMSETEGAAAPERENDYAKARLVSTISKIGKKNTPDD